MAAAETIENTLTGQRLVVHGLQAGTEGPLLRLEATDPPGTPKSPEHVHPHQWERFEVLEGELTVSVGGKVSCLRVGQSIVIPAGVPHAAWNAGSERMRMRWETAPGLRTAEFFTRLYELDRERKERGRSLSGLVRTVLLMREFADEVHVTNPPLPVQRLLFKIFGPLKRLVEPRGAGEARTEGYSSYEGSR